MHTNICACNAVTYARGACTHRHRRDDDDCERNDADADVANVSLYNESLSFGYHDRILLTGRLFKRNEANIPIFCSFMSKGIQELGHSFGILWYLEHQNVEESHKFISFHFHSQKYINFFIKLMYHETNCHFYDIIPIF